MEKKHENNFVEGGGGEKKIRKGKFSVRVRLGKVLERGGEKKVWSSLKTKGGSGGRTTGAYGDRMKGESQIVGEVGQKNKPPRTNDGKKGKKKRG